MELASPKPVTDLYFSRFGLATALHRRDNTFYVVFPRAYGMANGNKLFAQLNFPQDFAHLSKPPPSNFQLNARFWHRAGSHDKSMMSFDELMSVEPHVFKDTGIRRKVGVLDDSGGEPEFEERLIEVQLREEQFCQRCAWCGGWEYSYEASTRHRKVKRNDHNLYWCGDCSIMPKIWSRYWWQDPKRLDDDVYFFCKLP